LNIDREAISIRMAGEYSPQTWIASLLAMLHDLGSGPLGMKVIIFNLQFG
jgi:hypothetical protein